MRAGRLLRGACTALLAAWLLVCAGFAAAQVPVPPLTGHVVDQTGTLSTQQKAALESRLVAFEARKGSQLAVLMVPSTAPEPIEQFSLRVAEQWKLGRRKVDDGAILVVAKADRAVRVEVGYGLEGVLTDLTSKRIIDEIIVPRFRAQDFPGGITAALDQMMRSIDGESLPAPDKAPAASGDDIARMAPVLFVLAIAVGGVLRRVLGRLGGAAVTGAVVGVIAWFVVGMVSMAVLAGAVALVVTLFGGGLGSRAWGGPGGYYGGGRSGGFSGGGGGFGGGGASGRW